jgi:putative hydrolase of the HAD superfamily
MYEAVLSRLEKRPEETLYVGDGGSSELSGATAMGMRAVLLRIDHERHVRYDEEVDWRGEVITDLATVPELLER